jgi:hypothetical protein
MEISPIMTKECRVQSLMSPPGIMGILSQMKMNTCGARISIMIVPVTGMSRDNCLNLNILCLMIRTLSTPFTNFYFSLLDCDTSAVSL